MRSPGKPSRAERVGARRKGLLAGLRYCVLLSALGALFVLQSLAADVSALEQWRLRADKTRLLAENDVPAAYADALLLQNALPADAPATDRIRALNLLARIETYSGLTKQADDRAHLALTLARRNSDRIGEAEAQLTLALTAVNLGKIDALLAATAGSVTILEGVDRPDLLSEALLRTGMAYRRTGQINEAVTMAMRAMEIARRGRNSFALTYAHQGLGLAFAESARNTEARAHFVQMREQARAAQSKLLEADALLGMARASEYLDQTDAERLYKELLTLYRETGAPLSINIGVLSLAHYLREQRRFAEAAPLFDTAIATYERYPTRIGLWYALNGRSVNEQAQGNLTAALADAERALAIAREVDLPLYLSGSSRRLSELAAARGDYQRAYDLQLQAAQVSARAANAQTSAQMLDLTRRYEAESKRRQIEELTRRNEEQAQALQRHALEQRWLWTVLLAAIALFSVAAFFLFRLQSLNASLEERVQARTAELRQQTRYLRTLIDTLPSSVWLKDTQSRYLAANRANAEACGQTVEEMVGKSDLDLWPQDVAHAYRADDAEVMATRERKTVEERLPGPHGVRWTETFRAPVVDEDGSLLGTVGVAHDISARKAAEVAREAALHEAERLARLRSEFVAQMSHELRTPLHGILGYTAVLQRDATLNERQSAGLKVIQQSGEHLLRLINDVLDLAKIEAGKLELLPSDVALDVFLRSIESIIRVKADAKGLRFSLELAPSLPRGIRVDEQRLRQVLLNLLANAISFTEHGHVSLRVSALAPNRLRFAVEDTGIGISEQQLEAIFEPFEQVADARHRAGGTGLGLPISRKYVRLMGSDIQVESKPGKGSIFRFDLDVTVVALEVPLAEEVSAEEASATPEPLVIPPAPELADLHNLALQGNMRDIVNWARRVIELDGRRYRSFANHVRRLAESYESQAILTLVRQHVRDSAQV